MEAELHDARIRAGTADGALARLTDGLVSATARSGPLENDVAELRRLSHRVAHMTDVVFDRPAERSAAQPT